MISGEQKLHDFSMVIARCYEDVYGNSFFSRTARLCLYNALTYDRSGFKSRINRHLWTVASF